VRSGDVADRETNHNQAKTDAEQAQRAFDNANVQFTNGFGSAADLAAARSALERAKAELYRTEEQLKLYSNPNDKNQHTFFTVRAPLSGYIVERHINVGTQIRADNASPLFVISSLKRVWAYANIYEQDVRKVHVGLGASVEVLSYPGKEYLGHVDRLATALDEQSRVLQARINLPNPKGELRPEMFATIRMHLDGDTARRLSLPSRSVIFSNNHYYVVAGGHPKNFRLVRVEVIKNSANRSFVAAGHLAPGDTVLTDGNLTVFADLKKD
jgi:cobalt-zinc-cadmium efflux system membrane fusion protein